MIQKPIYLDTHATTPVDATVVQAMLPYFTESFGNPASASHYFGWEATASVDLARETIAALLGSQRRDSILFTSSGTEANNMVIKGLALGSNKKIHIISQVTEHKSVLESLNFIQSMGHEITLLPVNNKGHIDPADLKKALKPNTVLVSIMHANNEIGTIHPIEQLAKITHEHSKAFFHSDATQSIGKVSLDVSQIDFLTLSSHKIYGPKGVGLLYKNPAIKNTTLTPLLHGGGHEFGLRSGTLNVPGIMGFSKALEICLENQTNEITHLKTLRNDLLKQLCDGLENIILIGDFKERLPNNINIAIKGVPANTLMATVPEVAFSGGSACSSMADRSYVIKALGIEDSLIPCCIRLSVGRFTTKKDIDEAALLLIKAVKKLRQNVLV